MSADTTIEFFPEAPPLVIEPERYEIHESLWLQRELDRRQFFKTLGYGLVVLLVADSLFAQQQETGSAGRRGGGGRGGGTPAEVNAWIHIGEDGIATVFTGKTEVGQNIRTSLSQAVAEELRMPVAMIHMVMADTQLTPYDAGTFGSQTTPQMASNLHRVAAAAREALIDLAADHFKADRAALEVADGKVSRKDAKESIGFGELTKGQKLVKTVDRNSPTTDPKDWKIAGTPVSKVDGADFVTGRHKYASDIKRPGMLYGKLLRPETFGASLVSLDTSTAEAMPGVTVAHDGNFVGVTALDSLTATHAIEAIKAQWTEPKEQPNNITIYDYLRKNPAQGRGGRGGGGGANNTSIDEGLAAADQKFKQTYTIAYIAHIPLEPRAAVAEWNDGKVTIWMGTQRPFGMRSDIAWGLGISEDNVRVIVPDTGSAYGGKHSGTNYDGGYTAEAGLEAARLARTAGKPVKVVWTRQEEFTWAYFRPSGVIDITSGVKNDGTITAWEFHNYNSGGSAIDSPYDIAYKRSQFHPTLDPLKTGSYRGLAGTANHFARESHMDDMAHAVKMDPLEFRLKNLKTGRQADDRLRGVLTAAAEAFGWKGRKASEGRGFGMAGGTEKGSYIATCAEVVADRATGSVKVVRAVSAFDCGAVVNPDQLKNQIEGALVMGLGGALFEAIEFEKGMITNPYLADYRVPRFSDTPKIEVVLVDRKDIPSAGAGETPIMGIAAAVGNAIFDASGIRLRSMPMVPDGLKTDTASKAGG